MAKNTLITPDDAKVLQRQKRKMLPDEALIIGTSEDIVGYHTYDIIRAADYLVALGHRLQQVVRQRYEKGTL